VVLLLNALLAVSTPTLTVLVNPLASSAISLLVCSPSTGQALVANLVLLDKDLTVLALALFVLLVLSL
jgi:hypothetical protein